jgi:NADPH:quinone reductase-like Zn-dependent oxidoreductase
MKANEIWPLSKWLSGTGREWRSAAMLDPSRELKEKMLGMVEKGEIKVVVDSVWGMGDCLKGYQVLERGRARGKILVKVDGKAP